MRAAAEMLEKLERGEKVESLPNSVLDPTRAAVEAACREIAVDPPAWPLPEGGWRGPIFASAARPSRPHRAGKHFTDPGKEAAIAGCIKAQTFQDIPDSFLISPEAFTEIRWRVIYRAAISLRSIGEIVFSRTRDDEENEDDSFTGRASGNFHLNRTIGVLFSGSDCRNGS